MVARSKSCLMGVTSCIDTHQDGHTLGALGALGPLGSLARNPYS